MAVVKTFWMTRPYSRPRVLVQVSSAINSRPTSCAVDSESAYPVVTCSGAMRYRSSATHGTSTPMNLANPTATAAMVPVWITRNSVQP